MSQSVALPAQPAIPDGILPPALTVATPPPTAPPLPETPKALMKRSKEVAKAVKQFVRENRSMQLTIEGKKYPRAEVWQFCAACFGVTPMVTKTEELLTDAREEMGFLAIAHAIDATGRVISGAEATCMCSESEWAGRPSFQIRSMAETRSCAKVLRNLFAYVMVMAGLCPTPAEEMGPSERPPRSRELKTQCERPECSNMISEKRRNDMRRKYGKALCFPCEKRMTEEKSDEILAPLNDPKQVADHIAQVKNRKANGAAQPIVAVMDAGKEEIPA